MSQYRMTYKSQGCIDDGGIGHDDYWSNGSEKFEANSDEAALRKARKLINERSGKHPCRGTFCDNRGLHVLLGVEEFVPEQKRKVL